MHKQILYILSLMGLLSFAACSNEENLLLSEETGEIRFSVVDTTEVEITTKATLKFDVNEFNVSLSRGNESIFSNRKYKDIAGSSITCSVSPDYVLTAESCTEAEAEKPRLGSSPCNRKRVIRRRRQRIKDRNGQLRPGELVGQCRLQRLHNKHVHELFHRASRDRRDQPHLYVRQK